MQCCVCERDAKQNRYEGLFLFPKESWLSLKLIHRMAFYIWQQSAPHTSTDTHVWLSSEQIAQRSHTTQVLV